MFNQLWNFVGFLGIVILIIFLIGVIFALIDTIYTNLKMSIVKKKLIKSLNKELNDGINKITIEKVENLDEEDV